MQFGGISADCQVSESSMITTLRTYQSGLATVQVVNHTHNSTVTFYQRLVGSSCFLHGKVMGTATMTVTVVVTVMTSPAVVIGDV